MNVFPILYKKTSLGKIQEWQIGVVDNIITTTFGLRDGKKQVTSETITTGVNLNKSNATTPWEQACLEAESTWKGKLKKGYTDNIADAQAGKTDDIIEGGIFPMLAHKFSEQGHKIKYPAIAQPKFDGHRCIAQRIDYSKKVTLWSRTRKPINSSPHIQAALEGFKLITLFDGELYSHDYRDRFEELSHFIKQPVFVKGCEDIEYHIYDLPHPTRTNFERYCDLESIRGAFVGTPVHIVESIIVNNEEELMNAFEQFLAQGYEGCMVRNCDGLYVNKRSYDLQKIKTMQDDEFQIIGVKEGSGTLAGHAGSFECVTKTGSTFNVKMEGAFSMLKEYLVNFEQYRGKMLTIRFQDYTGKNNVPRFPIGVRIRYAE